MRLSFSSLSLKARWLIVGIVLYVIFLSYLALTLTEARFVEVFSETGFFEEFSIVAWLLAAISAVACIMPRFSVSRLLQFGAYALLCVMCAMREADWHKKFTSDGILKLRYYTTSDASLTEKVPAAIVSALCLGLVAPAMIRSYLYLTDRKQLSQEATWVMLGGIFLIFFGKILDRSISVMTETFHIAVSPMMKQIISAQEEGLEMLTPLMIAIAFFWPRHESL